MYEFVKPQLELAGVTIEEYDNILARWRQVPEEEQNNLINIAFEVNDNWKTLQEKLQPWNLTVGDFFLAIY